jgi:hypothetical protein
MQYELIKINQDELQKLENLSEFTIEDVEIEDDTEYKNLCELLKKVKGRTNAIKEFFKEPKKKAHENHKSITRLEKGMLEKLNRFETLAKKRVGEYQLKLEEKNTIENPIEPLKVKGISSSDVYKWEIIDEDKIPKQYLMVNEKLINQIIKQTNGSFSIPGIEITKEKSVRVKG